MYILIDGALHQDIKKKFERLLKLALESNSIESSKILNYCLSILQKLPKCTQDDLCFTYTQYKEKINFFLCVKEIYLYL